jgi:hypothetical protein
MKWLRLLALAFFLPQFAFATAAVSGKLVNPNPSVALPIGSVARLDLRNCGGNYPVVSGASVTSRQEFPIATDGTWSGVLYRNDEISCGGVASTTYYTLSYFIRNIQSGPSRDYVCSQASCNFDSMTPMTVYPPPTPPAQPLSGAQSVSCTFTAATTWTCLNALNTTSVIVDLYDASGNQLVKGVGSGPTSVVVIINSVTATFASPASGTIYVVNAGNWTPSVSSPNNIIANPSAPQSITGQGLTLTSTAPLTSAGANSFTASNTFTTLLAKDDEGVKKCEQFASVANSTFDLIMAACVAALPSTGTGTADASNMPAVIGSFPNALTMTGNWTMSRSGTTVLFGQYTVNQGANGILVPATTNNVYFKGSTPWGSDTTGHVNGTVFQYTGGGVAHALGDSSGTSLAHIVENVACDLTTAGAGATCFTSTRVYGAVFSNVTGLCPVAANTDTFIQSNGTSTAPGGQSAVFSGLKENNCQTGVSVIGGTSPPLCNDTRFVGTNQFSGNSASGSTAIDIECGNNHNIAAYIGAYDHGLVVNSPTGRAVIGDLHAENCGTDAVKFGASATNNWVWLDSGCAITDTGGTANQNTVINAGNSNTTMFVPGSITALSTARLNIFFNGFQFRPDGNCAGIPAATAGSVWLCGGPGSPAGGTMYVGDGTGWQFNMVKRTASTNTTLFQFKDSGQLQINGGSGPSLAFANLALSATAPTVSSGFGTSPSIVNNNGTVAFTINVGTGGTATNGVIGLPTAATGWHCVADDLTTQSATVFYTHQIATSTTTATIANFNTAGAQAAWVASDVLRVSCFAY